MYSIRDFPFSVPFSIFSTIFHFGAIFLQPFYLKLHIRKKDTSYLLNNDDTYFNNTFFKIPFYLKSRDKNAKPSHPRVVQCHVIHTFQQIDTVCNAFIVNPIETQI